MSFNVLQVWLVQSLIICWQNAYAGCWLQTYLDLDITLQFETWKGSFILHAAPRKLSSYVFFLGKYENKWMKGRSGPLMLPIDDKYTSEPLIQFVLVALTLPKIKLANSCSEIYWEQKCPKEWPWSFFDWVDPSTTCLTEGAINGMSCNQQRP